MQVIPHYTIRFIDYYERTYKRPCPLIENESMFYRNLIQIILKVVINFRKHLIFDQDEASPSKLKFKHLVLHMTNNVSTKYTQAEGLINLTDDIVEIKVDDTNYDMFNKETILIGIMLVARKLKKMPSEEAIYVIENLISCIQYISKYNLNEYIIEGMRQVIDILIDDKPEDETRLAPEKKIEFVRYMVNKINDLIIDRKDTGKTNELIVKIYDQAVRVLEQ